MGHWQAGETGHDLVVILQLSAPPQDVGVGISMAAPAGGEKCQLFTLGHGNQFPSG